MSLLLDALKKAEQTKRSSPLELADARPAAAKPTMAGVAPGPTLGSAAHRAEQDAARTLFAARQPAMQNRALWLLVGGLALLAMAAGGFWLWYTLTYPASQPPSIAQPSAPVRRPVTPAVVAPEPSPAEQAPISDIAPLRVASAETTKSPAVIEKPRLQAVARRAAVASAPQLRHAPSETPSINPELTAAYSALTRGDYAAARQQYQQVVRDDPFNLDAYLGLATVAASTGDPVSAQAQYRRVLEIDPKNSVAASGLAVILGSQNAAASESRLKAQIAAQPQEAAPHSTLGHVYASQSRWGEAQQAFFEAYRLESGNPDYAFNLAVCLDHLGQSRPAREYYGKALQLAASRPAGFDTSDVTARLNQLTP